MNVASSAALIGESYAAAYCASKAGLVGMTKSMAMEYIHQPIRINAVAPGACKQISPRMSSGPRIWTAV